MEFVFDNEFHSKNSSLICLWNEIQVKILLLHKKSFWNIFQIHYTPQLLHTTMYVCSFNTNEWTFCYNSQNKVAADYELVRTKAINECTDIKPRGWKEC